MVRKNVNIVERAPRGKTVELDVVFRVDEECYLDSIKISGDFFVYPPSAIDSLEEYLKGCSSPSCIEEAFRHTKGSEVLGFTWDWLEKLVKEIFNAQCTRQH